MTSSGAYFRQSQQYNKSRRSSRILGFLLVGGSIIHLTLKHINWSGLIITSVLGAALLALPWFIRRAMIKAFAAKAGNNSIVNWTISESAITTKTDLASSECSWFLFRQAIRFPEGFMLFPDKYAYHWLPIHAFSDPQDVERFATLAKAKIPDYQQRL